VLNGALLQCNQGTAPCSLVVLPTRQIDGDTQPTATVQDYKPVVNIATFVLCKSPQNPATKTNPSGQAPCVPVVTSAWSPGSSVVTVADEKALTDDSTCSCQLGGTITIASAGSSGLEVD